MTVDEFGFPGASFRGKFDGGDTAAIVGTMIALGFSTVPKPHYLRSKLLTPEGLVRHPDPDKWYSRPNRFSRDQLIPILCSHVEFLNTTEACRIKRLHQANKFLRAWNTKKNYVMEGDDKPADFTGPEIWALWIRIFYHRAPWYLKALLPLFDLETLVGSILWRWYQPKVNRVTRNHMLICLTGLKYRPTWVMRLACRLNDWDDLIGRWYGHCLATNEWDTAPLFEQRARALKLLS